MEMPREEKGDLESGKDDAGLEEDANWIEEGRQWIMRAASKGDWEGICSWLKQPLLMEYFIEQGEPINMKDGWTIFHILASHGHHVALEKLFQFLPEACKDGMIMNMPNRDGDTALHLAVAKGHYDTVKVLLEKGNVGKHLGHCNKKRETVFHLASNTRNSDRILMLLLSHAGKESNNRILDLHRCLNQEDECGHTFFHRLVDRRNYVLALSVLEEQSTKSTDQDVLQVLGKVACDSEDIYGETALFLLLKKESSFFASTLGQLAVKPEVDRQLRDERNSYGPWRPDQWRPMTLTRAGLVVKLMTSTRARLLVALLRIWARVNGLYANMPFGDTLLLYLGNAGLVNALRPFLSEFKFYRITRSPSGENVLQFAARMGMTKFVDWFKRGLLDETHSDWAKAILCGTDDCGRTALHYAAMRGADPVARHMAEFATQINQQFQWFEKIKAIMPPYLVYKKTNLVKDSATERGETAEEMFLRQHEGKAEKHAESARSMANTIMSVVAAVAFATTFTLPTGLLENSGKLKHKDVGLFTFFVCAYVLGLSFAATTIVTSLVLSRLPFTVRNSCTSIPRMYSLCLVNLFLCLLFLLAAFGCNLHMSFARYGLTKFTILYALMLVGPLLAALVYYTPTTKDWTRRSKSRKHTIA